MPFERSRCELQRERAMIWSRTDRPSRMWVDWSLEESFARRVRVPGPNALADTDFTARLDLSDLPPGEQVFYRVTFEDLANPGTMSQSATGRLRTPGS